MTDLDGLRLAAFHEAGHAVVATLVGWPVEEVWIDPGEPGLGNCELSPTVFPDTRWRCVAMVAGACAARMALGSEHARIIAAQADGDFALAHQELEAMGVPDVKIAFAALCDAAEELLDASWEAVEHLAGRLLETGTVAGPDLPGLLGCHSGGP